MYTLIFFAGLALTAALIGRMFYLRVKESRNEDTLLTEIPEHQLSIMKPLMVKYQRRAFEKMCNHFELVDALYFPLHVPQDVWEDVHYYLVVTREETGVRYELTDITGKCEFSAYIDLLTTKKEFQLALIQKDGGKSQRLLACLDSQVQRIRNQLNEPISFADSEEMKEKIRRASVCFSDYQEVKDILFQLEKDWEWITDVQIKHEVDLLFKKFSLLERNISLLDVYQSKPECVTLTVNAHLTTLKRVSLQLQDKVHQKKVARIEYQLNVIER